MSGLHFDHTTAMIQFNARVTVSHPSFGVGISNHSSFSRYKPPEGKAQMASKYLSNEPVWKKLVAVSEIQVLSTHEIFTKDVVEHQMLSRSTYNFTHNQLCLQGVVFIGRPMKSIRNKSFKQSRFCWHRLFLGNPSPPGLAKPETCNKRWTAFSPAEFFLGTRDVWMCGCWKGWMKEKRNLGDVLISIGFLHSVSYWHHLNAWKYLNIM